MSDFQTALKAVARDYSLSSDAPTSDSEDAFIAGAEWAIVEMRKIQQEAILMLKDALESHDDCVLGLVVQDVIKLLGGYDE